MAKKSINDNSLTVKAGLSVGLIGKARKAKKGLHSETIEKILHAYPELNPVWFLTGKEPRLLAKNYGNPNGNPNGNLLSKVAEDEGIYMPKVVTVDKDQKELITIVSHKAAAGYLNGYADPEWVENLPTISLPGYKQGTYRAFEVRGNSMPPLHSGSFSVGSFVEKLSDIKDRRVYIIVTVNDGIVVKRVINRQESAQLILISDNPNKKEYPNYIIDHSEVKEIWYWCGGFIREFPDPSDFYNRMNELESKLTFLDNRINQIEGKSNPSIKQ
ncbi:S24 family peptidase [Pelobium manganitolerans]|uniref:S24 family peptidase n=1 Tax=Pelobium manganitolerans TaxID=1842495 RepID=UPI003FA373A9